MESYLARTRVIIVLGGSSTGSHCTTAGLLCGLSTARGYLRGRETSFTLHYLYYTRVIGLGYVIPSSLYNTYLVVISSSSR